MLKVIGRDDVVRLLELDDAIAVVRRAMSALSAGATKQMLRQIIFAADGNMLSLMAGLMPSDVGYGSKVISVFPNNYKVDRSSHQGVAILFDPRTGAPLCIVHAGELTRIRTAAASAAATDALARADAGRLAVLGYGEQGRAHMDAIARVRSLTSIRIWGRSMAEAARIAEVASRRLGVEVSPAATVRDAVRDADIVCTTTAASDPILPGEWVGEGTHVNLVGSSEGSSAEADNHLVARARFFADHREGVIRQGGEFLRARAAGVIGDDHVLAEIGDVFNDTVTGRTGAGDVTIYKSLGHIVQDIFCARHVYQRATEVGAGSDAPF